MAYTEFCCRSGGSNLNAGTRTGNSTVPGTSASFTYASGSWVSSTGVFTVASGNPSTDGVAVGDFASVYADGASVTTLVGRVTAVSSTTITVSTTAKSGSTTDGTGNRTLKIGGAWAGPSGSVAFPFNFITNAAVTSAGDFPRVNFMVGTYSPTAAITHANAGIQFQGFTSAYGDGGRATIDGGTSGATYTLLTVSGSDCTFVDLLMCNNGATGSGTSILQVTGSRGWVRRCVFKNSRGSGLYLQASDCAVDESESFSNLQYGFISNNSCNYDRCIAHDNTSDGFYNIGSNSMQSYMHCIADTNGGHGFSTAGVAQMYHGCDAYNNTSSGFNIGGTSTRTWTASIENCNAVKNGAYGIAQPANRRGVITNCGFGSGSQANTSGAIQSGYMEESGNITYASGVTPWVDPANGDFRITLAAAKGAGRGTFTQTASGYSGTVAYPDIGAAQHADAPAGGGGRIIGSSIIKGLL